jgi:signal recognition particle receptor subunit beta
MAFINYPQKEIQLKIVYYGCGFGGKTTNLQTIHKLIDNVPKSNIVSLATSGDRTLFFDFMSLKVAAVGDFMLKFQLYTVPGQPVYSSTRQLVLRGVDAVVFVVDSAWERMPDNVESFQDLQQNLKLQELSVEDIPIVIQYNKRDLPEAATIEYLEYCFNSNKTRFPAYQSIATSGEGVLETLNAVTRMLILKYSSVKNPDATPNKPLPIPAPNKN